MRTPTLWKASFAFMLGTALLTAGCRKNEVPASDETSTFSGAKKSLSAIPAAEVLKPVGNGTFYIVNRMSGKVLDVSGNKTADGSSVVQYGGAGVANQKWTLAQLSGGYYSIIGVQSSKGLQINQASTADGGQLTIGTYTSALEQQWQFTSVGNGYYRIINRNSGKDLDVYNQSVEDNANVVQWGYWGGENQQWALVTTDAQGQLGWQFSSTANMPADVQARITAAMNDACARYNAASAWPARTVNVEYNTGVGTADANSANNNIRFGPNSSYQNTRTAMHELGHIWGVGQTGGWYANISSSGQFTGAITTATIRALEGPGSIINTGGGHFWPYGLNYDNEWSEAAAYRHVKIVFAKRADGM
jgi:Ricin-type beta-trefoil lectin domain-like